MIKPPHHVALLGKLIRSWLFRTFEGGREQGATRSALGSSEAPSQMSPNSSNDDASARVPWCKFMMPPGMFWILVLLFVAPLLYGAEQTVPSLIPNTFAPESAPAHSISHL